MRVSVVLAVDVTGAVVAVVVEVTVVDVVLVSVVVADVVTVEVAVVEADDVWVLVWVVVWLVVCVVVMVVVCVLVSVDVCVVVTTHVVSSVVFSVSLPAVNTICESAQVVRFARHSTLLNLYSPTAHVVQVLSSLVLWAFVPAVHF